MTIWQTLVLIQTAGGAIVAYLVRALIRIARTELAPYEDDEPPTPGPLCIWSDCIEQAALDDVWGYCPGHIRVLRGQPVAS